MSKIRAFFLQIRAIFSYFWKWLPETSPPLVTRLNIYNIYTYIYIKCNEPWAIIFRFCKHPLMIDIYRRPKWNQRDQWNINFSLSVVQEILNLFFSIANIQQLKGTLMQIWKFVNISVFIWKYYVEDFTLKHLLLSKTSARQICEKFVCKHSETIECVKN